MYFSKLHGLGNDFVVLPLPPVSEVELLPAPGGSPSNSLAGYHPHLLPLLEKGHLRIKSISSRKRGIGCDQLIAYSLAAPSSIHQSKEEGNGLRSKLFLWIFNGSTGDEVGMCGNAVRCVVRHFLLQYEVLARREGWLCHQVSTGAITPLPCSVSPLPTLSQEYQSKLLFPLVMRVEDCVNEWLHKVKGAANDHVAFDYGSLLSEVKEIVLRDFLSSPNAQNDFSAFVEAFRAQDLAVDGSGAAPLPSPPTHLVPTSPFCVSIGHYEVAVLALKAGRSLLCEAEVPDGGCSIASAGHNDVLSLTSPAVVLDALLQGPVASFIHTLSFPPSSRGTSPFTISHPEALTAIHRFIVVPQMEELNSDAALEEATRQLCPNDDEGAHYQQHSVVTPSPMVHVHMGPLGSGMHQILYASEGEGDQYTPSKHSFEAISTLLAKDIRTIEGESELASNISIKRLPFSPFLAARFRYSSDAFLQLVVERVAALRSSLLVGQEVASSGSPLQYERALTIRQDRSDETRRIETARERLAPYIGTSPESQDTTLAKVITKLEAAAARQALRLTSICDVGNPHCALLFDIKHCKSPQIGHNPLATLPLDNSFVAVVGYTIECCCRDIFPQGTNVEFVFVAPGSKVPISAFGPQGDWDAVAPISNLRMRVWERGEGITEACGSGACATALAGMALSNGTVLRHRIALDGGSLDVSIKSSSKSLPSDGDTVALRFSTGLGTIVDLVTGSVGTDNGDASIEAVQQELVSGRLDRLTGGDAGPTSRLYFEGITYLDRQWLALLTGDVLIQGPSAGQGDTGLFAPFHVCDIIMSGDATLIACGELAM